MYSYWVKDQITVFEPRFPAAFNTHNYKRNLNFKGKYFKNNVSILLCN